MHLKILINKIVSNYLIPTEVKAGIILQLRKSYEIFGKDKYIENFLRPYQEVMKRYRHFDTICWSIYGLTLTVSFGLVGYLISIAPDLDRILIVIFLFCAFVISFLGYLGYIKIYELARNTRKYLYIIEEVFGFYFLSYTEPFLKRDLKVNEKFSIAAKPQAIFSIKTYLLIFEVFYLLIIIATSNYYLFFYKTNILKIIYYTLIPIIIKLIF